MLRSPNYSKCLREPRWAVTGIRLARWVCSSRRRNDVVMITWSSDDVSRLNISICRVWSLPMWERALGEHSLRDRTLAILAGSWSISACFTHLRTDS